MAADPTPVEMLTQIITKSVLTTLNQKLESNKTTLIEEVKGLMAESTPDITEKAAKRV